MANASHAGVVVRVDDIDYEFCPLTVEDMEWLENWLKSRAIEAGRMSIPADLTDAEHDRYMRPILEQANQINIMTVEGFQQLMSVAGVSRMLWRMLLRKQRGMELEIVQEWCNHKEKLQNIMPKISTLMQGAKKGVQTEKPKTMKNRKR